MSPERNALEFTVYNSLNIEKLSETMNARADRLCAFLLILLGSAVFASIGSAFWLGFMVAVISATQFVCRFGESAGAARAQKLRYTSLLNRMSKLSDTELAEQLERIEDHDGRPLAAVEEIAFNKARLMRGCKETELDTLSRPARVLAYFIGGNPCSPPPRKKGKKKDHGSEQASAQ